MSAVRSASSMSHDPYGASIYGDTVRTPGALVGGQLGYNWQRGEIVYGLEADLSWAAMDGTKTCFAFSGDFISSNCWCRDRRDGHVGRAPRMDAAVRQSNARLRQGRTCAGAHEDRRDAEPAGAGCRGRAAMPGIGAGRSAPVWSGRCCRNWTVKAEYAYSRLRQREFHRAGEPDRRIADAHSGYRHQLLAGYPSVQDRHELRVRRRPIPHTGAGAPAGAGEPFGERHAIHGRRALRTRLGAIPERPRRHRHGGGLAGLAADLRE